MAIHTAQASITGSHPCRTWLLSLQSHHDFFAGQVEAGWIRYCFYRGRCKQVRKELPDSSMMAFVPCVGLLRPRKCLEPLAIACDMFLSPRTKTRKAPHHATLSVPFTLRPALVAGFASSLVDVKAEAWRSWFYNPLPCAQGLPCLQKASQAPYCSRNACN